jgi:hypothetical protein
MNTFEKNKLKIEEILGTNNEYKILEEYNVYADGRKDADMIYPNKTDYIENLVKEITPEKLAISLVGGYYNSSDYIAYHWKKTGYLTSSNTIWECINVDEFLKYLIEKYSDYSVVVLKEYVVMETYTFKTRDDAVKKANEVIKEWEKTKRINGDLEIGKFIEGNKQGAWYDNTREWGSVTIIPTTIEE